MMFPCPEKTCLLEISCLLTTGKVFVRILILPKSTCDNMLGNCNLNQQTLSIPLSVSLVSHALGNGVWHKLSLLGCSAKSNVM